MVTRFQRSFAIAVYYPAARGRNAEFLDTDEIVSGILSVVSNKPGYAAMTCAISGRWVYLRMPLRARPHLQTH